MGARYTDLKPGLRGYDPGDPFRRETGFISLRWRLIVPLFAMLLAFAMILTYIVTDAVSQGGQAAQTNQLLVASRGAAEAVQALAGDHVREATRLAFTEGVLESIRAGNATPLHVPLRVDAAAADLDSVILLDAAGVELLGLLRASPTSRTDYTVSVGAEGFLGEPFVLAVGQGEREAASGLVRTPLGLLVYTAVSVTDETGARVGEVLVGTRLARVLDEVRSSSLGQAALYGSEAVLLQATFGGQDNLVDALVLSRGVFDGVLTRPQQVPVEYNLTIAGIPFQAAYLPFAVGQEALGVLGVFLPNHLPYATDLSRQLLSLLTASLTGALVIASYVAVSRVVGRVGRVTRTVQALARGEFMARTAMRASDEVGELGRSLDVYADRVQQRQESLQTMLRHQRRENARLTAVLQSIPDGVVVQDLDGRVLMMNEAAREMLGSQRVFRSSRFSELTAVVTDVLGPALAPGLYALGRPQRIPLNERMLSAQAAAIVTISGKRVGTVIVLRDITLEVRREQARETLLRQLSKDIDEPLLDLVPVRSAAQEVAPLLDFVNEVTRNAVRLQRLVAEVRDLADFGPAQMRGGQRPLAVEDLLNALAAEWRPAAVAAELSLQVMVRQRETYVLGDERRLRWALGNLIDNAIKYTLPGGQVTITARRSRSDDGVAQLVFQDSGVGLSAEDQEHVFTRFYRGTPLLPDGTILRTPGMGQGLFIARRVIEAHGGTIRLESRAGQGARVIVTLPLTSPVAMAVPAAMPTGMPDSLPEWQDAPRKAARSSDDDGVQKATPPAGKTPPRR